jgi:hypothetical protein
VDALDGAVVVPPGTRTPFARAGSPSVAAARRTRSVHGRRSRPRSDTADASPAARPSVPPVPTAATAPPASTARPSGPTDTHPQSHSQRARQPTATADLKRGLRAAPATTTTFSCPPTRRGPSVGSLNRLPTSPRAALHMPGPSE